MPLDREQTKTFEAYERMFMSDGWRLWMGEIQENRNALFGQLLSSRTVEELHFLKGRADVFDAILGLESLMDQVRKSQEEVDQYE
jgi:hypothetical protein